MNDLIETRLRNPCGYREKIRHSRSARDQPIEKQFKVFKFEYSNTALLRIKELYNVPTNLDTLKFPISLPTNAFKNKRRNYESLQTYIKAFDTLANQNNNIPTTGNFTLDNRKYVFEFLANSSIRLLCAMYDEQKKHPKLKQKIVDFDKHLKAPTDFTSLYAQDQLLLNNFDKFYQKLVKVFPYMKKDKKKKRKPAGAAKKNAGHKNKNNTATNKKNASQKNKRKSLRGSR